MVVGCSLVQNSAYVQAYLLAKRNMSYVINLIGAQIKS